MSFSLCMSSGCFIILIVMLSRHSHAESRYDHEVKNYEIIIPLLLTSGTELEIQFQAFNRSFCLLLSEDLEFRALEIESLGKDGEPESVGANFSFYEGILNDVNFDSVAAGYLCNEVFCGTFTDEDSILYFVESAELFFSNSNYSGKAIIYRSEDVRNSVEDQHTTVPPESPKQRLEAFQKHLLEESLKNGTSDEYLVRNVFLLAFNRFYYTKGIDKSAQPEADYACAIEMVADHTLYDYFKQDADKLSAFLYLHAKYADSVFRKTDFDGDGYKDNIRIVVKKVFVYKSANDDNYPMAKAPDLVDFLQRFTKRDQNYCLSVCLCNRRYSTPAIGRAYKPGLGTKGAPGGICQKTLKMKAGKWHWVNSNLNTAVVTIRNSRGRTLPLITTLLAVAHEIGHSFGSDHDPLDNLLCSPGGEKGYYLMHPSTAEELKEYSNLFSPCSRQEIHKTMQERGDCLKVYNGTCGNGVREDAEECDCGPEAICKTLDPCCTPSDAKSPEKPCTFRRSAGAQCSARESPCCSKDCSVKNSTNTVCYQSDSTCLISYCEMNSSACPVPKSAPDAHPCLGNSKTCLQGQCNSSVCQDNDLKDCTCKERQQSCFVCCEKDNRCLPAHILELKNKWLNVFVSLAGSRCNGSDKLRCDGVGNCIDIKTREMDEKGRQGKVLWWSVAILTAVFIILLFIFLYLLKLHLAPRLQTGNLNTAS